MRRGLWQRGVDAWAPVVHAPFRSHDAEANSFKFCIYSTSATASDVYVGSGLRVGDGSLDMEELLGCGVDGIGLMPVPFLLNGAALLQESECSLRFSELDCSTQDVIKMALNTAPLPVHDTSTLPPPPPNLLHTLQLRIGRVYRMAITCTLTYTRASGHVQTFQESVHPLLLLRNRINFV